MELFLHQAADLELDGTSGGHGDGFEGLGVLRLSGFADFDFENPEVTKLKTIPAAELIDDAVEEKLNDVFHLSTFQLGAGGDLIDEFFLRDRAHDGNFPGPIGPGRGGFPLPMEGEPKHISPTREPRSMNGARRFDLYPACETPARSKGPVCQILNLPSITNLREFFAGPNTPV